ncbi:MAG: protein-disulfide reductase DsbD domain-containing protein, partial [Rhodomicrobium sp.]
RMEPGWHTYWENPGDSGEPTHIEWNLPDGVTAGPVLWPLPHTIAVGPLVEYGYDDEVLLLTAVQIPENAKDSVRVAAKVSYLVCKDICVPEETRAELTLPVANEASPSEFSGEIAQAKTAVPVPLPATASYALNPAKGALRLTVSGEAALFDGVTDARFFPLTWGAVSNSASQASKVEGSRLILDVAQGDTKETPETLKGVLALTRGGGKPVGFVIAAVRGPDSSSAGSLFDHTAGSAGGSGAIENAASAGVSGSVGIAVLFAFLGGVILNLMPCVFPVLALKAFGLAQASEGGHRQQGLAYLGGVLLSFAALAASIVFLREGSAAIGWGFQFQSPAFVLALAALFLLMGLSLSGVVSFGGSLMPVGEGLAREPGNAGYFFTGVLAAIAATPCTAPFMGAAIGYAITGPAYILAAVMLSLGLGFAAPVVALSFSPALQKVLPKPGPWMETLKQVLAFPLYATAAWLVWVLSIEGGSEGVMAAALTFVGIGFAAWLAGKTALSSYRAKLAAPLIGIAALAAGLGLAVPAQTESVGSGSENAFLKEEPFTQARLEELKTEGHPVFVNLTAAWCITCKVNERLALKSEQVGRAFRDLGIAYLKGDWTNANPEITALLARFGRAGVPLYLFYPGRGAEPRVLPQLLTAGLVLREIATKAAVAGSPLHKGA